MTIAVVPAGGLARVGDNFATYSSYGQLLDELGESLGGISIYAPVIERSYPEYEYHADHVLKAAYCRVIPLPAHPRGDPRLAIARNYASQFAIFLRDIRRWRRALIYTPSATASLATLAWRVMRAHPQKSVVYVWGDWEQLAGVLPQHGMLRRLLNPIQRRAILRQEKWLVRHADATLVAGAALLRKYANIGRAVTETVPMIKMDELVAVRPVGNRTDGRLLFVGRVVPGKGLETLLQALALLRTTVPTVSLVVVGGGDAVYGTELAGLAHRLGVRDAVEFMGVITNGGQLWSEYEKAKVLVCPSESEGFPRVLYEAMALGTPIVSTAVGGIPALLNDGQHALLVPAADSGRLAEACKRVLVDNALAERLAQASRLLFAQVEKKAGGATPAKRIAALLHQTDPVPEQLF